jgi:hypothetical protein
LTHDAEACESLTTACAACGNLTDSRGLQTQLEKDNLISEKDNLISGKNAELARAYQQISLNLAANADLQSALAVANLAITRLQGIPNASLVDLKLDYILAALGNSNFTATVDVSTSTETNATSGTNSSIHGVMAKLDLLLKGQTTLATSGTNSSIHGVMAKLDLLLKGQTTLDQLGPIVQGQIDLSQHVTDQLGPIVQGQVDLSQHVTGKLGPVVQGLADLSKGQADLTQDITGLACSVNATVKEAAIAALQDKVRPSCRKRT